MRYSLGFLALCLLPAATCAQSRPGTQISFDLAPTSVEASGENLRINYAITNRAESQELIYTITFAAPAGVVEIWAPGDPELWSLARTYRGAAVAEWAALGEQLVPGKTVEDIGYSARGVVGWVDAWVGGYVPPPSLAEDTIPQADSTASPDPLVTRTVKVRVIGLVPEPTGGNEGFVVAIQATLADACAGASDAKRGLCRSLSAKLAAASMAIRRSNYSAARGQLSAFASELGTPAVGRAQLGPAYWLLVGNAKALIARLGAQ